MSEFGTRGAPGEYRPLSSMSPRERAERERNAVRILAVEDSASARRLLQGVLLRLGVALPDIRLASDASEALKVFSEWRPSIVFVDVELRGPPLPEENSANGGSGGHLDGDQLAVELLSRNPRLNLVVVTAYDRDHPRVKALLTKGAVEVIVKPVLAAKVEEVLGRISAANRPAVRAA